MLHILFILSSPVLSGGERYLLSLSKGLIQRGHQVIVLCSQNLVEDFKRCGARVYPMHLGPKLSKRNFWHAPFIPLMLPWFIFLISHVRQKYPINIIHVQYKKEQILASLATKFMKIKTVWTEHGPLHDLIIYNPLLLSAYRMASLSAGKIIVVSEATKLSLESAGIPRDKLVRIYNGVECDPFEKPDNSEKSDHTLAIVAGLIQGKGHIYLLEAVKLLRDQGIEVSLKVVGDGLLRNWLEQYVAENDLKEHVSFLGQIPHPQVKKIIEGVRLVVMPSDGQGEGLPYAVLEAMERGKAIVATSTGGIPELVVHGETGLLVPSRDPGSLAEAIKKIIGSPRLATEMGIKGRTRVETMFSLSTMVTQTENAFLELTNSP